jgi:hypothetical protein
MRVEWRARLIPVVQRETSLSIRDHPSSRSRSCRAARVIATPVVLGLCPPLVGRLVLPSRSLNREAQRQEDDGPVTRPTQIGAEKQKRKNLKSNRGGRSVGRRQASIAGR